jgi:hypothetical protein
MDKDIEKLINVGGSTASETAHLTRRIKALEPKLAEIKPYAATIAANKALLNDTLTLLGELRALAAPATAAGFDAKRAEILEALDKMRTAGAVPLGMIKDGLASAQANAIATLNAIVTNGFVLPADVTAAQTAIDALTVSLTDAKVLVDLNDQVASDTIKSIDGILQGTRSEISDIESEARQELSKKVDDARSYYARIMTNLSLSLDAAIGLTTVMNDSLNPEGPIDTGTVVDFMA